MASLAGLAGHLPGRRPARQRHHRAHPHLAADRPLFSDPPPHLRAPTPPLDLDRGRPGRIGPAYFRGLAPDERTQTLEVTCLDTYGSLECVIVSPEGRRLVVTAPARSWPGRPEFRRFLRPAARLLPLAAIPHPGPGRGPGPVPGQCRGIAHLGRTVQRGGILVRPPGLPRAGLVGFVELSGRPASACPCPWSPGVAGPNRRPSWAV